MKRIALYIGLAVMLVASCSTQEADFIVAQQDDVIFYASFEQPSEVTRVYANENLFLRWTADDRVSIFNKNTYNQQYKFLGETGDNAGGFKKVDAAEFMTGNPISNVVSVYPYQETTKISEDETLNLSLPAEQHYAENTFGLGANTLVSVSTDNFLQYKNICGYLRISLYGEGVSISSITLQGNNGEKLAGKATVTMPLEGVPSIEMEKDASTKITLVCDNPIKLQASAEECIDFWFVVPPISFSKGFTILIDQTTGEVYEKTTAKSVSIERSRVSKMAPVKVEVERLNNVITYKSRGGTVVTPYNMDAFDAHLVSNQYTDGVGKMVFDADLTVIGDNAFRECNLISIIIPPSVVSIGDCAFLQCFDLSEIVLPHNLKNLGYQAFYYCSSLKSLSIPNSVETIGRRTFYNCYRLKNVELPASLKTIEETAFYYCPFESISIPESVSTIESSAFIYCRNLRSVTIPHNVISIGHSAFSGCDGLSAITVLPDNPPVCSGGIFGVTSDFPIYVPLGSIVDYKTADYWRDYADRILPIEGEYTPIPKAIDLGLPSGIKWASFNLGASKPEEYGDYYAWGETEPYYSSLNPLTWKAGKEDGYDWSSYKWCHGTEYSLIKYCNDSEFGLNGFTDGKTTLDVDDDVARIKLGGGWRMPTYEEFQELVQYCIRTTDQENGVNGTLFTSSINGNSIFLPNASNGALNFVNYYNSGSNGYYYSSSLGSSYPCDAWYLATGTPSGIYVINRSAGLSIRPVYQ